MERNLFHCFAGKGDIIEGDIIERLLQLAEMKNLSKKEKRQNEEGLLSPCYH